MSSRYYTSAFLGHGRAIDLFEAIELHVGSKLGYRNLVQVSMDGPNVNLSLFNKLQQEMENVYDLKLLNVGTCGLHTLHNAFKQGFDATGWKVSHFLSSLHTLFDETPARRQDFEEVIGSAVDFALPFCNHRWLENINVANRAISMMPNLKKYVKSVEKGDKPNPDTKSFDCIKAWVKDPLAVAKLSFFNFVATPIDTFLRRYQTDIPMIAFLGFDLDELMRTLMGRFIKSDVVSNANNAAKLLRINVKDDKNYKPSKEVHVGFIAEQEIGKKEKSKSISQRDILQFKSECKSCLIKAITKLQEKFPLCQPLVRNL